MFGSGRWLVAFWDMRRNVGMILGGSRGLSKCLEMGITRVAK